MITVKRRANLAVTKRHRKHAEQASSGRIPRAARLMALAIRFDQLIRDGAVADQAELARLGHVSRARLTQIFNLISLAPDIQEAVLFHSLPSRGRVCLTERQLRPILASSNWRAQRRIWQRWIRSADDS